jgi:hypothetical protein
MSDKIGIFVKTSTPIMVSCGSFSRVRQEHDWSTRCAIKFSNIVVVAWAACCSRCVALWLFGGGRLDVDLGYHEGNPCDSIGGRVLVFAGLSFGSAG